MRRFVIATAVTLAAAAPALELAAASPASAQPRTASRQLLALRGHFGGGGLFGRRTFNRPGARRGFLGRRVARGFFHRIARFLAFAFILHLLFSRGGLSILIWLLVIGLLVHLVRSRRRARNA